MRKTEYSTRFYNWLLANNTKAETALLYQQDLMKYLSFLAACKRSPLNYTEKWIIEYDQSLRLQGYAVSSIARYLSSVRTFYAFLYETKVSRRRITIPFSVPVSHTSGKHLSDAEFNRLLAVLDPRRPDTLRDGLIYRFLRLGYEVGTLLRAEKKELYAFAEGKDEADTLLELLTACEQTAREKWGKTAAEKYLFLNHAGEPITRQGAGKQLKKHLSDAGLSPEYTLRSLAKPAQNV